LWHRGLLMLIAPLPPAHREAAVELWHEAGLMLRADNDAARGFYAALGYGHDDVVVFSRRLG